MASSRSERRRAENEVAFRDHNQWVLSHALTLMDQRSQDENLVGFICECSNEDCQEHLEMSVAEFRGMRENQSQFVTKKGHQQTDIEQVVRENKDFQVVEKFQVPPASSSRSAEI